MDCVIEKWFEKRFLMSWRLHLSRVHVIEEKNCKPKKLQSRPNILVNESMFLHAPPRCQKKKKTHFLSKLSPLFHFKLYHTLFPASSRFYLCIVSFCAMVMQCTTLHIWNTHTKMIFLMIFVFFHIESRLTLPDREHH